MTKLIYPLCLLICYLIVLIPEQFFSTGKVPLHSLLLIPLIGWIHHSTVTVPVQTRNYWCKNHDLHTSGTYPSWCWCNWWINLSAPLRSENGYTVDQGENKLNGLQILFSPWFFQFHNIVRVLTRPYRYKINWFYDLLLNRSLDKTIVPFIQ